MAALRTINKRRESYSVHLTSPRPRCRFCGVRLDALHTGPSSSRTTTTISVSVDPPVCRAPSGSRLFWTLPPSKTVRAKRSGSDRLRAAAEASNLCELPGRQAETGLGALQGAYQGRDNGHVSAKAPKSYPPCLSPGRNCSGVRVSRFRVLALTDKGN